MRLPLYPLFVLSVAVVYPLQGTPTAESCPPASGSSTPSQPQGASSSDVPQAPAKQLPQQMDTAHLPNAVRVTGQVISGGEPADEAAFEELRDLGVKTIVSVDGVRPKVALAQRYGLRYVHLPHGYDGIAGPQLAQLAKAVRELGPVYLHCHHGKHRSPAAAAAACIVAGLIEPQQGAEVLQLAGTSPHYRGLVKTVRDARPLDMAALERLPAEFPQTAALSALVEAMVALEQPLAALHSLAAASWQSPAEHPDLNAAHQALLLREHYTEMLRMERVQSASPAFRRLMGQGEEAAVELAAALRAAAGRPLANADIERLQGKMERVEENCRACHTRFRDVPQGELGQ
ncbi:MAG: cytochrome c [Planctomycetales bacterium]|nr:cytochrome c [Planctomycetales bacterium]